ncbi:MAG: glycosyltransferase [Kiritimatiellae bacterium]|nr:glycosyltransferase [Kiritimatiellia bacterium]
MAAKERLERKKGSDVVDGREDEHRVAVFRRQGFFLERVEAVCGPVYEIKIRHLVRFSTVLSVFRLKKWMLEEKFDVVHTWDAESAIFGGAAAVLAGVPLITSRRDLGAIYPCWKRGLLRWMDRRAVRVVVNARAIGRHFTARRGRLALPEEKICFIPNVIDLVEFDRLTHAERGESGEIAALSAKERIERKEGEEENEEWKMENEECSMWNVLKVVCVSRMDPEKDHECLLKAFKRLVENSEHDTNKVLDLRSSVLGLKLFLVGDGMERKRLEKMVFELKIGENVHFLGERSDISAILNQMDVGVLIPKSNEGLSNSILEYMAAGLPVVCSDCGGNAELVKQGENGFVVPISDEKGVFFALKELESAEKREKMGKNGRKRVEKEFSMDFVLKEFEGLYGRV